MVSSREHNAERSELLTDERDIAIHRLSMFCSHSVVELYAAAFEEMEYDLMVTEQI